jgi:hypothetical protein
MRKITLGILLVAALAACSPATPVPPPVVTVVQYQTPVAPTQPLPAPTTAPTVAPTLDPHPQPTPTPQRIAFPPGGTTATVTGKITSNVSDHWVLRVLAGQTLSVNLVPVNGQARLIIYGADGTVLISDHADAMQWSGRVPSTQDYHIKVNAYDGTAPSYTLQVTVPPLQPTAPPQPAAKRITFAPGAISATVSGITPAVGVDRWILAAQAGQTMTVNLIVPPGGRAALVIYGADGTVLISDHASAMQWSGQLPKTQDYHIDVKPETGAVSYTLQVTIPPR